MVWTSNPVTSGAAAFKSTVREKGYRSGTMGGAASSIKLRRERFLSNFRGHPECYLVSTTIHAVLQAELTKPADGGDITTTGTARAEVARLRSLLAAASASTSASTATTSAAASATSPSATKSTTASATDSTAAPSSISVASPSASPDAALLSEWARAHVIGKTFERRATPGALACDWESVTLLPSGALLVRTGHGLDVGLCQDDTFPTFDMMFGTSCSTCGTELMRDVRFCSGCGETTTTAGGNPGAGAGVAQGQGGMPAAAGHGLFAWTLYGDDDDSSVVAQMSYADVYNATLEGTLKTSPRARHNVRSRLAIGYIDGGIHDDATDEAGETTTEGGGACSYWLESRPWKYLSLAEFGRCWKPLANVDWHAYIPDMLREELARSHSKLAAAAGGGEYAYDLISQFGVEADETLNALKVGDTVIARYVHEEGGVCYHVRCPDPCTGLDLCYYGSVSNVRTTDVFFERSLQVAPKVQVLSYDVMFEDGYRENGVAQRMLKRPFGGEAGEEERRRIDMRRRAAAEEGLLLLRSSSPTSPSYSDTDGAGGYDRSQFGVGVDVTLTALGVGDRIIARRGGGGLYYGKVTKLRGGVGDEERSVDIKYEDGGREKRVQLQLLKRPFKGEKGKEERRRIDETDRA